MVYRKYLIKKGDLGQQWTEAEFKKAVDTIGLLKIIISVKPYLVSSNGERLIV